MNGGETKLEIRQVVSPFHEDEECPSDNANSMHHSLKNIMILGQCFALCPVQGIRSIRAKDIRFSWKSLRVAYTVAVILAMLVSIVFALQWINNDGLTFKTSEELISHVAGFLRCVLFLRLAKMWPDLVFLWQKVEQNQKKCGYPRNLRRNVLLISTVMLSVAIVEYILYNANAIFMASNCSSTSYDLIRRFFMLTSRHIFQVIKFSGIMAVFAEIVHVIWAFYWSFADVFVMVVSLALKSRFRAFNKYLIRSTRKGTADDFWRVAREDYNELSELTKYLDSCISGIVLLSFALNLFYICQQLLYSITNYNSTLHMIYLYWSFAYLLIRSVTMALCAASVHEESKSTRLILYGVPSLDYHLEVHRFLLQVATDQVALTGLNFFPVTRTVLLTLAGTIVTYEVVLVQFGTSTEDTAANLTDLCFNMTKRLF